MPATIRQILTTHKLLDPNWIDDPAKISHDKGISSAEIRRSGEATHARLSA
jgi:hypothetical protein